MRISIILVAILIVYCNPKASAGSKIMHIAKHFDTITSDNDLNPEWLKNDRKNFRNILSLLDNRSALNDKDQFVQRIINLDIRDTKYLGFGLTFFECAQYGGYVTTWISLLSFENIIIQYDIRYSDSDFKIIDYLIKQDRELKNEISFVVDTLRPFSFYYKDNLAFARFKANVAKELGSIKLPTDNSDENLISNCSILTEPINSYDYGTHCYYSGNAPDGRRAINYFSSSNNTSVIREIIKGYNPEGRLYAIEALLTAVIEKKTTLTNEDKKLIKKVLALNIPISICSGCIVSKSTADESLDKKLKDLLTK